MEHKDRIGQVLRNKETFFLDLFLALAFKRAYRFLPRRGALFPPIGLTRFWLPG